MAKVMVPVIRLKYDGADAFDNELHDVFEAEGVWSPVEDFTFTGRVSIGTGPGREAKIARLKERVTATLVKREGEEEGRKSAARLITLLELNEWDVSFFVDCF